MDSRVAKAEIVTRLRDHSLMADGGLRVSDVERLSDWMASPEFCAICRAAAADADSIIAQFNQITDRSFNAELTALR
jgi:hypothetical protein